MRYSILLGIGSILIGGFGLFIAYYFMLWPLQPSLETDDPVIAEWLQQDGIVVYRRGEELADSRMYILKGERVGDGCSWHVSLSSGPDDRIIVNRQIATNHATCESLSEVGYLAE